MSQGYYIVKEGNTSAGIAQMFGLPLSSLISANPQITNPNYIRPGDRITIPQRQGTGAGASSSDVSAMLALVNGERRKAGVPPLALDPRLCSAAQAHCLDMAQHHSPGHVGSGGSSLASRITGAGYTFSAIAENVGCAEAAQATMDSFMKEVPPHDGHKRNVLNPTYHDIGIGYATDGRGHHYWTLDFAKRT
jgi:uncharacterized protein YkwD